MIMCLDEFNIGGVTPDNMARALGDESLDQFVERYIHGECLFWTLLGSIPEILARDRQTKIAFECGEYIQIEQQIKDSFVDLDWRSA